MNQIMLSDCVAYVESRNNAKAMRYEPTYKFDSANVYIASDYATGGWIDTTTAAMIVATSWGAYQIMGDHLYGQGYRGTIVDFLNNQQGQQKDAFDTFLETIGFIDVPFDTLDTAKLDKFALRYNGSPVYAQSLEEAYQALKNV